MFPIGAITKGSAGEELSAIGAMQAAGAVAISDDGMPVMNARVMRRAMEFASPGAPGDVTVFSTDVEWTYDVNQSASRSRNSPFHGRTFHGGAMATVVDGQMKWRR